MLLPTARHRDAPRRAAVIHARQPPRPNQTFRTPAGLRKAGAQTDGLLGGLRRRARAAPPARCDRRPPGGRRGLQPRPGPSAQAQVAVRFGDRRPRHVIGRVFDHAQARDLFTPGPGSCWSTAPATNSTSARPRPPAVVPPSHVVIDFVRPGEAMGGCVGLHASADPAAEDRVATWALALLSGQVHRVTADLKHHRRRAPDDRQETASIPPSATPHQQRKPSPLRPRLATGGPSPPA